MLIKCLMPKIANDRLFVDEFLGVSGFVQHSKSLVSLEVYLNSMPVIYRIDCSAS